MVPCREFLTLKMFEKSSCKNLFAGGLITLEVIKDKDFPLEISIYSISLYFKGKALLIPHSFVTVHFLI